MALPKQIKFDLSDCEYRQVFNFTEGKKAKRTKYWVWTLFSVIALSAIIFIGWQFILACSYVNSRIDYSTFSFAKLNLKAVITAFGLLAVAVVTCVLFTMYLNRQTQKLYKIFFDKFHSGVIVMGVESFLYRCGDYEVNDLYKNLYEAHENEDYFLLITYEDDEIPVPKKDMDRDTFAKISLVLTDTLGAYFFKFGRSNVDITKHTLFGEPDKRKALKKYR